MDTSRKIVLRDVFKKVVERVYVQPSPDPATGQLPKHVKHVDSKGDMLLTTEERDSNTIFIKENAVFEIYDGITFDLDNPQQAAVWYAIQFCPAIASSRDARDKDGNLLIDGNAKRYGSAEFYIENPGAQTRANVEKTKIRHKAERFVLEDDIDHKRNICKLLGRNMNAYGEADITDYLLEYALKTPQKIIDLYTGSDNTLRIMILDAISKNVIKKNGNLYTYADTVLGGSEDSVVEWCKMPQHSGLLKAIKQDTYPNLFEADKVNTDNISGTITIGTEEKTEKLEGKTKFKKID